ncbi:caspase-3-like [Actinia tenebrosa]|uniref:Caspase-8 n=1 Tax=Actinia tenebrosa TaxID=6105 RepID=A0A6P8HZ29_ACTTE|nr:caspase-3-like [Actinia tenebrosa]
MNKEHRQILRKNRLALVEDLEPRIILNFLFQEGIFYENDLELVNSLPIRQEKAEQILDTLPRRGPKAFNAFYEALNSGGSQRHLADLLYPKTPMQETSPPGFISSTSSARPSSEEPSRPSEPRENDSEIEGAFSRLEVSGRGSIHLDPPSTAPPTTTTAAETQDSDVYPMNRCPHGLCLIVNNASFEAESRLNNRRGSNVDARNLQTLFTSLRYRVKLVENVRAWKLKDVVFKFAKDPDHKNSDSVIVCLLSHGLEGKIYGIDGGLVSIEDILKMFKGNNAKDLVGKPKLFFIQACRGGEFDRGISFDKTDSPDTPDEEKKVEEILEEFFPEEDVIDSGFLSQQSLPSDSDILIAYSTVPGFVSWRNQDEGSWFVQALVDVFKTYASKEDILSMITRVNRKVALEFQSSCKKKQMPAPVLMLTRKLYFHHQN